MRPDRPCQGSARVSACKRGVSQHTPGHRPCNQPRNGGADRLTNRALGLDDPQQHPAPRAYPEGRTNPAQRGPPSALDKTRQLTSKGIPPSAHGGTIRLNNWDLRRCSGLTTKHPRSSINPRGNPARAPIERGAASAHSRKPQPPTPQAYLTQGRAKAHSRQGNPPRTKSNSGAAALSNVPPLPPAASIKARSRHAARQRGSPGGGTHQHPSRPDRVENDRQWPSTSNRAIAALKAYPGTVKDRKRHRHQGATAIGPPALVY
ncbi:hypothetical protein WOLCODRAFT_157427 [Wolfiporia cocos MD-104 SS10]|uniref:Uncharacterized protein n=1 Tax=Wolfiporia cocos (strain MD-104) TaxID=742152 RepID=A0A2H3JA91_WOLCO|nr:hypothetical protein WOLCODRAFT_157427 [Wolfiporia cocos MD-104 SS10]